ncbi:MAG: hypothetical protein DRG83_05810 [Deltaproteobacteria bacterium]|nr:MAG: hypothetical protein DRG83_05810 [Deltaproteobacteria bacterium]
MMPSKSDWILLALRKTPLDRIRLMKTLFLVWYRSGQNIPQYFEFEPYLYGPCSLEVYSVLEDLSKLRLIVQAPHPVQQWANYYLTERGRAIAEDVAKNIEPKMRKLVEQVALEVSQLGFYELLRKVYSEAPEFAVNSLVREVIQR